jgi:hypothetical protein
MPCAWEIQPKVAVGILHTETVTLAWSFGLRNLILPPGSDILPIAGAPYDHARNGLCMQTLDRGFDYVFMLDSDVIPPRDTVLRLLSHKKPLISGIYHRRSPPHGVPVMIKNGGWVTQYPTNTLIEVDLVGAGCLLLSREFLESMPPIKPESGKHWFSWQVDCPQDPKKPGWNLSEDFTMNRWAREKMGVPILVDTGVVCRHVGYGEATYANMLPLNTTPHT